MEHDKVEIYNFDSFLRGKRGRARKRLRKSGLSRKAARRQVRSTMGRTKFGKGLKKTGKFAKKYAIPVLIGAAGAVIGVKLLKGKKLKLKKLNLKTGFLKGNLVKGLSSGLSNIKIDSLKNALFQNLKTIDQTEQEIRSIPQPQQKGINQKTIIFSVIGVLLLGTIIFLIARK